MRFRKKNTAKIIPNGINVKTNDVEHFFSFINRAPCYKVLHLQWKGYAHGSNCLHSHDHDHEHGTTVSSVHPEMKGKVFKITQSAEDIVETVIDVITTREPEEDYEIGKKNWIWSIFNR